MLNISTAILTIIFQHFTPTGMTGPEYTRKPCSTAQRWSQPFMHGHNRSWLVAMST